ncbi:hypothetical protein D3C78_1084000 [compost metagenome]
MWRGGSRQQRRYPVAQFNPGGGGLAYFGVLARDMQDLGPKPLRGINAADIAGIIGKLAAAAQPVDGVSLFNGGVVFPQNKHGIRVIGKFRTQCQHLTLTVDRRRCGTGGVNANANHLQPLLRGHALHQSDDRLFHGFYIVERMVAKTVFRRVAEFAALPAGVIDHFGIEFRAVMAVDRQHPHRVAAEVQSQGNSTCRHDVDS